MSKEQTTNIQVSHTNRELLLKLGTAMQREHPELWAQTPSFNAIVGFAVTKVLNADRQRK